MSRYKEAGVDIEAANRLVEAIKPLAASTHRRGVLSPLGGFAGLFALDTEKYQQPVLVSSTDGVGTKIKVAIMAGRHETIGIDLVAMCVNDILVCGAEPLFFLDYLACGHLEPQVAISIIEGIAKGCQAAGCALLGGETAECPGMYQPGDYDLAGFVVGVVEREKIIDGSEISVGDKIIGLASSGLHSNGFSLVRKLFFEELGLGPQSFVPELGCNVADELLKPTRIYAEPVLHLLKACRIRGIAHITGGGFYDNISRVLPQSTKAVIHKGSWRIPTIFNFIQKKGQVEEREMFRIFNCGVGMTLILPPEETEDAILQLKALDEEAWVIGEVVQRRDDEPPVEIL
ncbi:phosphoribosylformylglycinamidine cyclo-ligase [Thermosulfuriphilus sp.]